MAYYSHRVSNCALGMHIYVELDSKGAVERVVEERLPGRLAPLTKLVPRSKPETSNGLDQFEAGGFHAVCKARCWFRTKEG